jgi:hypothetical protein
MGTDRRGQVYDALHVLARRYPAHLAGGLARFEHRVFSQNGEDGVIAEVVSRVGAPGRYFVEFGAESGAEGNCVLLADAAAWSGLFIEADPELYGALEAKYASVAGVRTLRARVTPSTVVALFRQAEVPPEPDVLSIDVDGNDYWIWAALEGWRPRIVVVEYNAALDPGSRLVQPLVEDWSWDGTQFFGASLGALRALGTTLGYRLVHTDLSGVNAFFVREDLAAPFGPADAVVVHGPSYFLAGSRHPPDPHGRAYVDLTAEPPAS